MIDQYAIEVNVPALGKLLEFLIPATMKMADAKSLIFKMVTEQYPGLLEEGSFLWYIDVDAGKLLPDEADLKEVGLKSGSKIMLLNVQ